MTKITSFVLASSLVLASSTAFAGGVVEPAQEPAPVVVTEGASSSAIPLWAVIAGVVIVAAVLTGDNGSKANLVK